MAHRTPARVGNRASSVRVRSPENASKSRMVSGQSRHRWDDVGWQPFSPLCALLRQKWRSRLEVGGHLSHGSRAFAVIQRPQLFRRALHDQDPIRGGRSERFGGTTTPRGRAERRSRRSNQSWVHRTGLYLGLYQYPYTKETVCLRCPLASRRAICPIQGSLTDAIHALAGGQRGVCEMVMRHGIPPAACPC